MIVTSLTGLANILQQFNRSMPSRQHTAMEQAAQVVEGEAKRVIGTYDYGWPQLAPSTLKRKSANTPLLETGEMRDSIQHSSAPDRAVIGSNEDKAVWHELGTRSIPPRPFLSGALQHKAEEVVEIIGRDVVGALASGGVLKGTSVPYVQPIKLIP